MTADAAAPRKRQAQPKTITYPLPTDLPLTSEIYQLTLRWAERMEAIIQTTSGSAYQHSAWAKDKVHLQWSTGLPSLHPAYLGRLCTMGKLNWPEAPGITAYFMIAEERTDDGFRPLQLYIAVQERPNLSKQLGFFLQDRDEAGRLVVLPMYGDSHEFMQQSGLLQKLTTAGIYAIMSIAMQVPYEQDHLAD